MKLIELAHSNGLDADTLIVACTLAYLQQMAFVTGDGKEFTFWQQELLELVSSNEALHRIVGVFLA